MPQHAMHAEKEQRKLEDIVSLVKTLEADIATLADVRALAAPAFLLLSFPFMPMHACLTTAACAW
jgi:hypothetical protein